MTSLCLTNLINKESGKVGGLVPLLSFNCCSPSDLAIRGPHNRRRFNRDDGIFTSLQNGIYLFTVRLSARMS